MTTTQSQPTVASILLLQNSKDLVFIVRMREEGGGGLDLSKPQQWLSATITEITHKISPQDESCNKDRPYIKLTASDAVSKKSRLLPSYKRWILNSLVLCLLLDPGDGRRKEANSEGFPFHRR